jgi:hypothetical protein
MWFSRSVDVFRTSPVIICHIKQQSNVSYGIKKGCKQGLHPPMNHTEESNLCSGFLSEAVASKAQANAAE